jgi:hypothetical protein
MFRDVSSLMSLLALDEFRREMCLVGVSLFQLVSAKFILASSTSKDI